VAQLEEENQNVRERNIHMKAEIAQIENRKSMNSEKL